MDKLTNKNMAVPAAEPMTTAHCYGDLGPVTTVPLPAPSADAGLADRGLVPVDDVVWTILGQVCEHGTPWHIAVKQCANAIKAKYAPPVPADEHAAVRDLFSITGVSAEGSKKHCEAVVEAYKRGLADKEHAS
jgi:hypothetical protein